MKFLNVLSVLGILAVSSSCTLEPKSKSSRVRLEFQFENQSATPYAAKTLPASLQAFACLAVNVFGPGITSQNIKFGTPSQIQADMAAGKSCGYPGIVSPPILKANGSFSATEMNLTIPSGFPARDPGRGDRECRRLCRDAHGEPLFLGRC